MFEISSVYFLQELTRFRRFNGIDAFVIVLSIWSPQDILCDSVVSVDVV